VLLGIVLTCAVSRASADGSETAEYKEAVSLGLAEFDERNFFEARAQFARAHGLYPNARTSRALGMVYFELKDYVQSVHFLEEALSSRERPLDADKREKTEQLLKRARGYVARFEIDMEPEANLAVDGEPSSLRSNQELMLGVGEHTLEFHASGRVSEKRTLNVQGGEHDTLRVRLLPATAVARGQGAPDTGERAPAARPVYKNPWLWTALGIVVAGGAAAAAIMLTRSERVEDPYPGTGGIPPLMGLSQ
jgi:hypothetical protein